MKEPCEVEMGTLEQFHHTADIGILARAGDLPELLALCLEGLIEVIAGRKPAEIARLAEGAGLEPVILNVECEGQDSESLFVAFLTDILFYLEVYELVALDLKGEVDVSGRVLKGQLKCVPYQGDLMGYFTEVKAVTYHMIRVEKCEAGGWGARLLFDI